VKLEVSIDGSEFPKKNYITVSGRLQPAPIASNTAVVITCRDPRGKVVDTGIATVGAFTGQLGYAFVVPADSSWIPGRYGVTVTYGNPPLRAESYFDFISESEAITTRLSKEKELAGELRSCPAGQKNWSKFQNICKRILTYCLVPPLTEPTEESSTRDSTQRRDLVFRIPYNVQGFFNFVLRVQKSQAIIVDCKNYGGPLPANLVVIMAKYLGKKRLSTFGIIISRHSASSGAKKERERLWNEDDKLILFMKDTHLLEMLDRKEKGTDPAEMLDKLRVDFIDSI
jgi:hypothetical protein